MTRTAWIIAIVAVVLIIITIVVMNNKKKTQNGGTSQNGNTGTEPTGDDETPINEEPFPTTEPVQSQS